MKFKIQITETLQRIVEKDVFSAEVAQDVVMDDYNAEKIRLDSEDFKDVEFEVVE